MWLRGDDLIERMERGTAGIVGEGCARKECGRKAVGKEHSRHREKAKPTDESTLSATHPTGKIRSRNTSVKHRRHIQPSGSAGCGDIECGHSINHETPFFMRKATNQRYEGEVGQHQCAYPPVQ